MASVLMASPPSGVTPRHPTTTLVGPERSTGEILVAVMVSFDSENHANTESSPTTGPGAVPESLSTTPHSLAPYTALHVVPCGVRCHAHAGSSAGLVATMFDGLFAMSGSTHGVSSLSHETLSVTVCAATIVCEGKEGPPASCSDSPLDDEDDEEQTGTYEAGTANGTSDIATCVVCGVGVLCVAPAMSCTGDTIEAACEVSDPVREIPCDEDLSM